jgi:hypothetical protein
MRRLFLNSGFAFLIVLSAFFSFVNPFPVQAANERYFVMGQVFLVDGIHINCDLDGRWATAGNKTLNLTDDGTHGTFSVYMANGTTGTVTSGTSTISGSPVTLSAGLNSITATGSGTATLNITIGTAANWNTVNSWSAASGGACTASVPTSTNSVYFNVNSFTAASQILTVDATAYCLNMDWTGSLNTPTLITSGQNVNVYGSLTFISAMLRTGSGTIIMTSTSVGKTIDWGGLVPTSSAGLTFNGIGGEWTLSSDVNINIGIVTLTNGNVVIGNKTITCGRWVLTTGTISANTGAITLIAGNGTPNFEGGSSTNYNTVNLNGTAHTVSGSNTFVNLTRNGTATKTDTLTLTAGTTQTVTGTCALIGNSAVNRLLVQSSTLGTAATITATDWTGTNAVDFMDITSTNAVNLANELVYTQFSGDCGGNTGITFTAASPQISATTASWATIAGWQDGIGTDRVPLPQDDVTCSHSKTVDMPRIGRSVSITGTPAMTYSVNSEIYGSLTLVSGQTGTWISSNTVSFRGRGIYTLTTAGKSFGIIYLYAPTGTLTLQDNVTGTLGGLYVVNGTFSAGNKNVIAAVFRSAYTSTRGVILGTGTWTLNTASTTGAKWSVGTLGGFTLDSTGSTIIMTNSGVAGQGFVGGDRSYNNVTQSGAGDYALTISGNNTFNTFTVDRSVANKTLTLTDNSTQTVGNFICATSGTRVLTINSSGSFGAILTKTGGSTINMDYLNLTNNTGSPSNTWYYGANSTIGAGVTGWQASSSFTGSGSAGGSGAGGGTRGAYTSAQGYDGSNAYNFVVFPAPGKSPVGGAKTKDLAGGGGGAGSAGTAATMLMAGVGGDGYSCDITGVAVKYSPGGGGGARNTKFSPGAGGVAGGGAGGEDGAAGTAGTVNTGGGGGGGGYHNESMPPYDEKIAEGAGGAGGSGIVIVKYSSTVVTFTSSTTWTVPAGVTSLKVLVVGGGGGGGESIGGGGGGGGVVYNASYGVTPSDTITVTVGAGGAGGDGTPGYPPGAKGGNSVFGTLIALGGGGGAGYDVNAP